MKTTNAIIWLSEPEKQDYSSALSYLSLIFDEPDARLFIRKLKKATTTRFKAKDIFRASALSLLGVSNKHVNKDLKKIRKEIRVSPLLLVRNPSSGKVIIADGYHRLCAVYSLAEDVLIPCKIV
jgi:hypothetical protein